MLGQSFAAFYPPANRQAARPQFLLREVFDLGAAHDSGWQVRKDSSRFWAEASVAASRDECGPLLGYSRVARDLTQLDVHARVLTASDAIGRAPLESVSGSIVAVGSWER